MTKLKNELAWRSRNDTKYIYMDPYDAATTTLGEQLGFLNNFI